MNARARLASPLVAALLLASPAARGDDVDTQFLFGFTQGADTGEPGDREIEWQLAGRFGKADGRYAAYASQLRGEFSPWRDFRFEAGIFVDYHSIAAVSGFDDREAVRFGGFVGEARWRILDRRSALVGLTIGAEPHWAEVDDLTGQPVSNWGSEFSLALDRELVSDRLFAAINLLYDPEWTQFTLDGSWQKQSTLGLSAALTGRLDDAIFVGIEAHHLLTYDGTGLESYSGQALFVGPTAYWQVTRTLAVSAAWSFQVAGGAVDLAGPLNLRDYERYEGRLRLEYNF